MWVTKNKNGWLYLWQFKPRRGNSHWHAKYASWDNFYSMLLDEDSELFEKYNFLKWEDEPLEVNLVSKTIDEGKLDKLAINECAEILKDDTFNYEGVECIVLSAAEDCYKAGFIKAIEGYNICQTKK